MKKQVVALTLALLAIGQASFSQNNLNNLPKKVQKELKNLQYIPGGTFSPNANSYDTTSTYPSYVTLSSYYLSQYEVTNANWKDFHKAMVAKHGVEGAKRFLPDTTAWTKAFPYAYNEPMTNMYYWHPAYNNYPVVGVSWNQAQAYCNWKTEDINTKLKAEGKTDVAVTLRLPTEYEWMYAATPPTEAVTKKKEAIGKLIKTGKAKNYLWNLYSFNDLIDKNGYQANFGPIRDTFDFEFKSFVEDGGFHTLPVTTYKANSYGLYNLKGNAEEWVSNETAKPQTADRFMKLVPTAESNATMHLAKGGSWYDGPYYLSLRASKAYPANTCSPITGFRLAMDIVEVKPAASKD